jgi:hypothetical protein
MAIDFPDPNAFGESEPKPHEKIDPDEYTSLFDFEED